eukprot:XP_001690853.1 predicted protein [Chlamydomonas reinhardtii]
MYLWPSLAHVAQAQSAFRHAPHTYVLIINMHHVHMSAKKRANNEVNERANFSERRHTNKRAFNPTSLLLTTSNTTALCFPARLQTCFPHHVNSLLPQSSFWLDVSSVRRSCLTTRNTNTPHHTIVVHPTGFYTTRTHPRHAVRDSHTVTPLKVKSGLNLLSCL